MTDKGNSFHLQINPGREETLSDAKKMLSVRNDPVLNINFLSFSYLDLL